MLTILTALGLIAVCAGAAVITKAHIATSDESLVALGVKDIRTNSSLFALLDNQRINTSLGLSLTIMGSIALLLHFTGLALTPATVTILAFLVLIVLIAYGLYARQLRATQPQRFAALLARIVAAEGNAKALTAARPGNA